MKIRTYLEPFGEFFFSSYPFRFRCMRFFARFPFIRQRGFDQAYSKGISSSAFSYLHSKFSAKDILDNLGKDGCSADLSISPALLDSLRSLVDSEPFVDRATQSGEYRFNSQKLLNPGEGYSYAIMEPHRKSEDLYSFAMSDVKRIADAYLGADAYLMGSLIWVTFPNEKSEYNPEFGFHYDMDDYRFLKLFVYLSDVDSDCGPHQIIYGSHRGRPIFRFFNRRLTFDEASAFGESVKTMTGKAGEGFFEDTLCYHRGVNPKKPRLILQIQFSLSNERWNS
jgi:hypothetical protein